MQVQPSFALPAGQPGGQVQQPVAQQFRGRVAELTFGQGKIAEAGQQGSLTRAGSGQADRTLVCTGRRACLPLREFQGQRRGQIIAHEVDCASSGIWPVQVAAGLSVQHGPRDLWTTARRGPAGTAHGAGRAAPGSQRS